MSKTIRVDHLGTTYVAEVMTIQKTSLGVEDHGILTAMLSCSGSGSGIGVGGYALDAWVETEKRRVPTAYGLDHLVQIMSVVGVERWEDLTGRQILVLFEDAGGRGSAWASAKGIGSLSSDDVLIFADHAAEWKEKVA